MDTSSVFHIDMLDKNDRANFSIDAPWLFQTDDGIVAFVTEADACLAQRVYRRAKGLHPTTGAKISV